MKSLRVLLLILLAVLLPVRGAFAGTMACATAGAPIEPAAAVVHEAMPHEHAAAPMHHGEMHHGQMHHAASPAGGLHDDPPPSAHAAATCQFCASGCCMASLIASVPAIGPAPLAAAASFPPLLVPAPAFESGGLERPPRPC